MFITIKKGNLILTAITLLLAFLFSYTTFFRESSPVSSFSTPVAGKTIVIDPGHGGIDAGASNGDIKEKELNLEIAHYLKAFIEENGGTVIMSRTDDSSTADPNRPKTVSQKLSDLRVRKELPEKSGADIFVSIHMNKFSESQYKGAQVFCAPKSPQSKSLGEIIQNSLIKNLDSNNNRQLKEGNSIFILKDAKIPSVLVECGFISNPEEAELLQKESYQQKVAWSVFMGISEYLADTNK